MDVLVGKVYVNSCVVEVGKITINLISQEVTYKGKKFHLSPFQYRILEYLALRNGAPLSKAQLAVDLSCSGKNETTPNAVAVEIARLRTLLGIEGNLYLPSAVTNQRGYTLCAP